MADRRSAGPRDVLEPLTSLPDDIPIALLPLRLETRLPMRLVDGVAHRHLWVRVFPDDVLVDTFEPELSTAELADVTAYWTARWRAAHDQPGHRAAWSVLVRARGSGRARWLIQQVAPIRPDDEPTATAGRFALVVTSSGPVSAAERGPVADFWTAVWSSRGADRDAAFAQLTAALGAVRAAEIERSLRPSGLDDRLPDRAGLAVDVVFLELPAPSDLPMSDRDWTRPATAELLPERLVLIGTRGGIEVLRAVGRPIPSVVQVGPDPAAPPAQQLRSDDSGLHTPDQLAWTVDFERAVADGLGFSVDLDAAGIPAAFDRLFVLGVRRETPDVGAAGFARLLQHHQAGRGGLALLPQGAPSNNTDQERSAYSWWDDPDVSFGEVFGTPAAEGTGWTDRPDGAWLAGAFGIPIDVLRASSGYASTDGIESRAMSTLLWPATMGTFLEQQLGPVVGDEQIRETKEFVRRFVLGGGVLPPIRVGRQPYGVIPVSAWSRSSWWLAREYERSAAASGLPSSRYLAGLHKLLDGLAPTWESAAAAVARVDAPSTDPQQTLLDVIGLHPRSAEFVQRYAQSAAQFANQAAFTRTSLGAALTTELSSRIDDGLAELAALGWTPGADGELPPLLLKVFHSSVNRLTGDLVDGVASETAALPAVTGDGRDYLRWLADAARTSHDALRRQEGFADQVPSALLYLLAQHALDLGFVDAATTAQAAARGWDESALRLARREPQFLQISTDADQPSRWRPLYETQRAVTGDDVTRLGDYLVEQLETRAPELAEQLAALDQLVDAPTAALERAMIGHLDTVSYRIDAWRLGVESVHLSLLRGEGQHGFAATGLLVGAYGWVDGLAPHDGVEVAAVLSDEVRAAVHADQGEPILHDSANLGHLHAPSLDQAITAAILRNGAAATAGTPAALAVDLSSERVRWATRLLEGVRNGQPLGALLGYQFERELHDEPGLYLDRLFAALRRAFPLAGDQLTETAAPPGTPITALEARQVVDGRAMLDALEASGAWTYPYGVAELPPLSTLTGPGMPEAASIGATVDAHVQRMRDAADSVADLSIAEGLYQLVRGNADRAAAALDAVSKGSVAPLLEVAATPRSGRTLTHRLTLHLDAAAASTGTPREQVEPAIAAWLADVLPDPATIGVRAAWTSASHGTSGEQVVTMAQLGYAPADLFALLDGGASAAIPALDEALIGWLVDSATPPPDDAVFSSELAIPAPGGLSLAEVLPLIRAVRAALLGARSLRPTDLLRPGDAASETAAPAADVTRVQAVESLLTALAPAQQAFLAELDAAVGTGVADANARQNAAASVDGWLARYAGIVQAASRFGARSGGMAAAVDGRRSALTALLTELRALDARWTDRIDEFALLMTGYAALPGATPDDTRIAALIHAGRVVSTSVVSPLPPTTTELLDAVVALRDALSAMRTRLRTVVSGAERVGASLQQALLLAPDIPAVDYTPPDWTPHQDAVLELARELQRRVQALSDDRDTRVATCTAVLARAATLAGEAAQTAVRDAAQALLGGSVVVLARFAPSATAASAWSAARTTAAPDLSHLSTGPGATPYPLDDWLNGLGRVRERAAALEQTGSMGELLGSFAGIRLAPLQFPAVVGAPWLGMRLPTSASDALASLPQDALLYTAQLADGAEDAEGVLAASVCGLLLDEWVEVIPGDTETTGVAFHFDRPDTEAPQAILLAMSPQHGKGWQWDDLVQTLHETLDLAAMRAVEPGQLQSTPLGRFLPTIMTSTPVHPITPGLNFSYVNHLPLALNGEVT